jgi:hypothetical protein
MSASVPRLLSGPGRIGGEPASDYLRIPVAWSNTSFECGIKTLAQSLKACNSVSPASEPVRLRVNESGAGSCRVEFFCGATRLCGASAGC